MTLIDTTSGMLELRGLDVGYYKDLNILQDLNVKVRQKQITTILGANGVGKSTLIPERLVTSPQPACQPPSLLAF